MFAYLAFVAACILFCLAVRNGREQSLHDRIFRRVPGSGYPGLSIVFGILAFFIKQPSIEKPGPVIPRPAIAG